MSLLNITLLTGGHVGPINSLSLSSNNVLASGGDDGSLCLWSANQSTHPVFVKEIDQGACSVVKFAKEKSEVIYTAYGRQIFLWDTRHMSHPVTTWMVNEDEINSLDLLESSNRLASADDSGDIKIVDTTTGEMVRTLHKHDNICSAVHFRSNKTWQLISAGLDCRVIVSDWKGSGLGVMIFEMEELVEQDTISYSEVNTALNLPMVNALTCSSSGSHVACGLENSTVELFNGSGRYLVHVESLYGHTKGVSCLLCVAETHLISGGNDGLLFVWQLQPDGIGRQVNHGRQVNALACGDGLDRVYVADCTSSIQLTDMALA